jgi:uncharacterized protein YdeI (YjbR/CyaY-like superfamily)
MKNEKWQEELELLRSLIHQTELEETNKWGGEVYVLGKTNVLSIGAFKNYVSLWFYDGVFLEDKHQVLENSQEGKTKALRSWKFTSKEEIDQDLVMTYIHEAIQNAKDGKTWIPEKNQPVVIPDFLSDELAKDPQFQQAFHNLTPFKQKEYCEHIDTAKREATKQSRLEKMKPMVMEGKGLHDKYR